MSNTRITLGSKVLAGVATIGIGCALLGIDLQAQPIPTSPSARPNIVFILADDFSVNLIEPMLASRHGGLRSLMDDGTTFANFFVGDSLCCPSRSTIFTGRYPHNTGVFTNTWAPDKGLTDGGFGAFMNENDEAHTFALALHTAPRPYTTAMLGKYLNGYLPWEDAAFKGKLYNVPSVLTGEWGWDQWYVAGNGYPEFSYDLFQLPPAAVQHYGIDAGDYLTDVVSGLAQDFIKGAKQPFFVEIATFAPHAPYRPAYRDETAFPGLKAPRTPAYDARPDANAPDWMKDVPPLEQQEKDGIDDNYRLRAQCVLAIDKMIADIRNTLKALGKDKDTYIFFSADNGYHMGEYSFLPGKTTPFDTDIRVPLVVVGPGVLHQTVNQIAQTVDLAPTFTDIGGNSSPTQPDGHSLLPLLRGQITPRWRHVALIEHHGPPDDPTDPDAEVHEKRSGDAKPPNYEALRSSTYMYVEYADTAAITSVSSTTTEATFEATNTFLAPGMKVTITGVAPVQFDLVNQTVVSASATGFTIQGSFTATSPTATSGTATAGLDGVSEYGYYDLDRNSGGYDPFELRNVYKGLPAATKQALHGLLLKNSVCGGSNPISCWSAQQ